MGTAGAVLSVFAFLVAGCGSDAPQAAPDTTTASSPAPTTVPPTPTTTSTTTPPPPEPPPYIPPPVPADGNDLKACQDGVCQVRVKRNAALTVGAGRPTFKVVKISPAGVDFQLRYPDGKRATLTLGPESGSYAGFGEPMSFQISLYSVEDNGTAILDIGPLKR